MPNIPQSMNLGTVPAAIPSIMLKEPREGRKSVPYTIAWARPISRNVDTVSINMQDGGTLEFSQICGIVVDNSNCGCDLDIIFPDTDVTVSIPAYAPYTCLQINTQQVQFFIRGINCLAGDVTALSILNYAPAPVAVPITRQQLRAGISNLALDGVAVSQIIPVTVNGTVQAFTVNCSGPKPTVSFNNNVQLRDGSGAIMWSGNIAQDISSAGFVVNLADVNAVALRFAQGLQLVQTGGFAPGATLNASVYYIA